MFSESVAALEAISMTFVTFMGKEILYSSILFIVVFAITNIFKKKSPYLHYGLWALVFVRLILPPDWSLSFSARSFFDRINVEKSRAVETSWVASQPVARDAHSQATKGSVTKDGTLSAGNAAEPTTGLRTHGTWQMVAFLAWAVGSLILVVVFLKRHAFYLRVVRRSNPVSDSRVLKIAQVWQGRFKIKRQIRLVTTDAFLSPFTLGVFRPVVYLPKALLADSRRENLESVIAHELAHVKQLDDLWIKFQNVVQLIYFFHPLVWLANSRLNQVRERICDELVLSYGTISPKAYGKSMLAILKMNLLGVEGVEMLPSFGNHKKKFSNRIQEINKSSQLRKPNLSLTLLLVGALALFLLPMAENTGLLSGSNGTQVIELRRVQSGSDYGFHTQGAGSRFQTIAMSKTKEMFCESKLPAHLKEIEFAALGIYDTEYRKIWVLKGMNKQGAIEFYLDTNGDHCFTDEQPLKVKKKTAKYYYEGESEWVLTEYLKSQIMVAYHYQTQKGMKAGKFPMYLVYDSKSNFLEFSNSDYWVGEVQFGEDTYPVALYGGLQSGWYVRPTFDEVPNAGTKNQLRVDFNGNNVFEAMTVFDPATNEVVQESYQTGEPILVNGTIYEVKGIWQKDQRLKLQLAPETEATGASGFSSSKS
ncbi:M56 family metallopeptidase [bacterium]|nr:M56 family metallopeptidase [bacterium]